MGPIREGGRQMMERPGRAADLFKDKLLLNVNEVADALGLSARTLYNKVSQGTSPIKPKRCGRALRFDVRDLMNYIDGL